MNIPKIFDQIATIAANLIDPVTDMELVRDASIQAPLPALRRISVADKKAAGNLFMTSPPISGTTVATHLFQTAIVNQAGVLTEYVCLQVNPSIWALRTAGNGAPPLALTTVPRNAGTATPATLQTPKLLFVSNTTGLANNWRTVDIIVNATGARVATAAPLTSAVEGTPWNMIITLGAADVTAEEIVSHMATRIGLGMTATVTAPGAVAALPRTFLAGASASTSLAPIPQFIGQTAIVTHTTGGKTEWVALSNTEWQPRTAGIIRSSNGRWTRLTATPGGVATFTDLTDQ